MRRCRGRDGEPVDSGRGRQHRANAAGQPAERRRAPPARRLPGPHDRRRHRQARPRGRRADAAAASARSAGIDFVTANGENLAGGMGLTSPPPRRCSTPASTSSRAATTSGTSARSTRSSTAASASCGRSTTARTSVPGRGWGTYQALDGTELAVINLQGRTYMQPIENPFTEADRLLDEASEPLPPIRLVDFHCELTSREERPRAVPRRAGERRRGHAHPRRHRRRADPAQGHGVPDRPRA